MRSRIEVDWVIWNHGDGMERRDMEVRRADEDDIASINSLDDVAQSDERRRVFIRDSVRNGTAWIAVLDGRVVGYVVLRHTFYTHGFVSMLYVHRDHRRSGIGAKLIRHAESLCRTGKLFTSTNESNRPMQSLLLKLGFVPSGVIDNLDPGDPELVYFKHLG